MTWHRGAHGPTWIWRYAIRERERGEGQRERERESGWHNSQNKSYFTNKICRGLMAGPNITFSTIQLTTLPKPLT